VKDRNQAEQIFQVLLENRPADISLAYKAAKVHGEAFVSGFRAGLRLIDEDVATAVQEQIDDKLV